MYAIDGVDIPRILASLSKKSAVGVYEVALRTKVP